MKEKFLSEKQRAEDILLGSLGYGEEACIETCYANEEQFWGQGRFRDGESFSFKSEDEITDLERWALSIIATVTP